MTPVVCPRCSALVADVDAHEAWHVRCVGDVANTPEQRERRRSLRKR